MSAAFDPWHKWTDNLLLEGQLQVGHSRLAFEAVYREYQSFTSSDPQGREQLATIIENLKEWHAERPRELSRAADYCVQTYVAAETDCLTPGHRGLGRMTDHVPRLAAKHRTAFSRATSDAVGSVREALATHIACGYLFAEFMFGLVEKSPLSNAELFEMWVPCLYSPPYPLRLDKNGEDIKGIWFGATGQPIRDVLEGMGVTWDMADRMGTDQAIVTHYFSGGMLLRMLEKRPLTKVEQLDVSSAGGYSAPKGLPASEQKGCALHLVTVVLIACVFIIAI